MKIELSKHPYYDDLAKKWQVWHDLYEGDHDVLSSPVYLWPHELETENGVIGKDGEKLRAIRIKRSRYLNLIEPIVSRWLSFLFRRDTNIPDSIRKMLGDEIADIDGNGTSLETFIREKIGADYVLYGKSTVLVDTSPAQASTLAEAKLVGARPYLETLSPLEIVDWQTTGQSAVKGQYQFLRTEFELVNPRGSYLDKPTKSRYSRGFLIKEGVYTQELYKLDGSVKGTDKGEWKLINSFPVKGDKIPISSIMADSFVKDAAEMQLLVFNTMSAESSGLNAQAFQRIFISGNLGKDQKLAMNEYLVNFLTEGSTVQTVEPYNAAPIQQARDSFIEMTFKVAFNQLNSVSATSKESPGADTRREMKDEFIALIQTSLTEVEGLVNNAISDYAAMKGVSITDEITFDKKVTEDDIDKEIALLQAHIDDFKQIPTLHKGILSKHAKYFGLPNEHKILEEIDATTFEANQVEQQQQRSDLIRGIATGEQ
jgi:hypothetical protein